MINRLGSIVLVTVAALGLGATTSVHGAIPASERDALIAIYNATGGPGWNDSTNWLNPPGSECTWAGVGCDPGETHVTGLFLGGQNLTGYIPVEIEDLTELEVLGMENNQGLTGIIPGEIGSLSMLNWLDLGGCRLGGGIPAALANLSNLTFLNLGDNNLLTGPIPAELGTMSGLQELRLNGNRLSGPIPPELGDLSNLRELHLWANQLSGPIPPDLGDLSFLINLSIDNNRLSGPIPIELTTLTALQWLNLGVNELNGTIPSEFSALPDLWWMAINNNQLTGPIPPGFGYFQNLRELHLSENNLTGTIPPELGDIATLEWLFLSWNRLHGSIPPGLADATNLIGLFLDNNRLSGPIPSQLGSLPFLDQLNLSGNRLSGAIPPQIWNLTLLWNLDLSGNCLEGTIPPQIGNLTALQNLHLTANVFVGEIPPQIASLTNLADGGNGIDFNGVHTADPGAAAFMDAKFGMGWRDTQTVPPDNLTVEWVSGLSAGIGWDEIPYQWDEGGYEILVATDVGGPYQPYSRTLGKQMRRWPVYDLSASSTYYVKVCTVTEPHPANQNTVVSELTDAITVNTTGDPSTWYAATTGAPGNDCFTPGTPCPTVQDALNRSAPGEQIFVAPGTYRETLGIGHPIRIIGDGAATTVIDGGDASTVVWVGWGRNLRMSGLTLRNGTIDVGGGVFVAPRGVFEFTDGIIADSHANAFGGGLYVDHEGGARLDGVAVIGNSAGGNAGGVGSSWGTHVVIADSTISDNIAPWGGGLYLVGNSIIEQTSVDGNTADGYGGGGIANEGMMIMAESAVTNNSAAHGGGIANQIGAQLEIGNSTISGNTGGGLFNSQWGRMEIESCTITDNSAPFTEHSGLMNWNELYLHNTIVAGNSPFNCANPIASFGYNLDDDATCGLDETGDLSNVDPLLGPLADNGGPTLTHALPLDSPAIDAGDPLDYPPTDQRGYERPSDGISAPDIGAFENTAMVFTDGFESGDLLRWTGAVP